MIHENLSHVLVSPTSDPNYDVVTGINQNGDVISGLAPAAQFD